MVLRVIVSLYFWVFKTLSTMVLYPVAVVIRGATFPFDKRLRLLHRFTSFWGSLYIRCNPVWSLETHGRENIPSVDAPCIIVANHQSFADIFVLFRLRLHYKWVSKRENFRAPFIGWNMTLNRYIPITRGTTKGNLQMMRACEEALKQGNSLMMFPEGTRSPDGTMRAFKDGAFELALRARCPILPIVIEGTAQALSKGGLLLGWSRHILVTILPALPYTSFSHLAARDVNRMVWDVMAAQLNMQQRGG